MGEGRGGNSKIEGNEYTCACLSRGLQGSFLLGLASGSAAGEKAVIIESSRGSLLVQ